MPFLKLILAEEDHPFWKNPVSGEKIISKGERFSFFAKRHVKSKLIQGKMQKPERGKRNFTKSLICLGNYFPCSYCIEYF